MSYRGLPSWPPVWVWVGGKTESEIKKGDVGFLTRVVVSIMESQKNRIFLFTEYEHNSYVGCLLLEDQPFCKRMADVLQKCCGQSIREIGALDVSDTL
jgi:hypothetical protein